VYVPVSANDSDAETLQQIPGVDENVAAALIAGRPYASNDAFVDELEAQIPDDQAAAAACYLDANP
jgi:radical SAM superfamily enzyme with C-terminal helix-hairpin-helix motif